MSSFEERTLGQGGEVVTLKNSKSFHQKFYKTNEFLELSLPCSFSISDTITERYFPLGLVEFAWKNSKTVLRSLSR